MDRWLETLVEPEQNCIMPFIILTLCSSGLIELLLGYSPPRTQRESRTSPSCDLAEMANMIFGKRLIAHVLHDGPHYVQFKRCIFKNPNLIVQKGDTKTFFLGNLAINFSCDIWTIDEKKDVLASPFWSISMPPCAREMPSQGNAVWVSNEANLHLWSLAISNLWRSSLAISSCNLVLPILCWQAFAKPLQLDKDPLNWIGGCNMCTPIWVVRNSRCNTF